MGMNFKRKLPIPKLIKELYPLSENVAKIKDERDEQIKAIFRGEDKRFILIIGPCSSDREDAVLDYVTRLAKVQDKVKDTVFIIPRIYTAKPHTTGDGYKGMVHQPDPNKAENMLDGIVAVRRLHTKVIEESGLTSADEMLYPLLLGYPRLCGNRRPLGRRSGAQAALQRHGYPGRYEESYRR